jgi:predicted amidohydrolase YtcJ
MTSWGESGSSGVPAAVATITAPSLSRNSRTAGMSDAGAARFLGFILCVLACAFSINAHAGKPPYAETVILNGKVITADSQDPDEVSIRQAIAVRGNTIMAVGSDEEIRRLVADWTEVIDAGGRSVVPGLIDTHNHIYENTIGFPWVLKRIPEMLEIHIRGKTVEAMTDLMEQAIAARASQVPEKQWIRVGLNPAGVAVKAFGHTITRSSLDRVAPDHPAIVRTRGGSVLNSKAIRVIEDFYGNKLDEDYWMVDAATGWSGEYTDFRRCIPIDIINTQAGTYDKYIRGYFQAMQVNVQLGITTYKTHLQCEGGFSASVHLARNDLIPMRFAWGHRWMQPFNPRVRETYRRIGDWTGYGSNFMWSIGSSVGGIDAGGVGWCTSLPAKSESIKTREQCPPAPEGTDLPFITDLNTVSNRGRRVEHLETLARLAAEGRITGIPGWHVAGDGALELLFQVYRKYMSDEQIRSLRIESDHCHGVTPQQIEVARRLGHTFSCDMTNVPSQVLKDGYGEEYLTMNAPVASMLKAGVNTVISTFGNYGVLRTSPFEDGVKWMTRKDANGETWGVPEEAVPDRMTLLLMMSRYGAYPLWKEDKIGSIEAGKWADITILNGDYMAGSVEDLDKLTSIMTMVGGRIEYEAPQLRGNTFRFNTDTGTWTVDMKTPTGAWRWRKQPEIPPFLTGADGV